jgi:hypothetical protein
MPDALPLKVFADRSYYRPELRPYLNEILRASWEERPAVNVREHYGSRAALFAYVSDPRDCDVIFLPLNWLYYVENRLVSLAQKAIDLGKQFNKPVVIFSQGDAPANLPFSGVTLFELSGYRSRMEVSNSYAHAMPVFIEDYVYDYQGGSPKLRNWNKKPVVGFCGQAGGSFWTFSQRRVLNLFRRFMFALGLRSTEPAPFETTAFRNNILNIIRASQLVETNFVIREKYRAGVERAHPQHPSRLEFVQNIIDSDYTVCMRGGGNFSVRFYETMCMGRIPVFIDTDCLLPFDDVLNYRDYCVWVKDDEIPFVAEKIADFHGALSPSKFIELQQECRVLWQKYFELNSFYTHVYDLLSKRSGELN